ncbi:MAG TPA: ABC transporter substrate-binding protein [Candidatus Dormibacteraeota bacterium]|nr:ABC transporter substrate-binding protein [Candidatus Dormibacteraeota bacterium]
MRERVVIVFLTAAIVTTAGLGGLVAYRFAHPEETGTALRVVAPGTGAPDGTVQAPASSSAGGAAAGAAPAAGSQGGAGAAAAATGASGGAAAGATGTTAGHGHAGAPLPPVPSGVSGGVITVGGIYDETGPVDATVNRDAVRSYFNQVNAAGGVNGYRLRLVDCDSAFDPTRGHQCSERLVGSGVLAMVGWLSASSEQTETGYLASQGVPVIGGLGVPAEFESPLSFPVTSNLLGSTVDGLSAHAVDLNIHATAVVIINTPFTAPAAQKITDSLHRHGIHEKSVDYADATKPDYTDLAVKIRLEGADSIIAGLDPFSYARFFQALDRQNFHPTFVGFGLDKKSAEKQYGTAVYNAESATPFLEPDEHMSVPAMSEYYGAVQRYFPAQVDSLDVYTEGAWVAAKLFVEAVRRLGPAPPTSRSLVDSLNHITRWDSGLAEPFSFRPGAHDPNRCFQWIRNQQGVWHAYSGWNCF